jgi:hypothetical protein
MGNVAKFYCAVVDWAYTIAAAALVFWTIATGLLQFSEWIQRNRADNKFLFQTVHHPRPLTPQGQARR